MILKSPNTKMKSNSNSKGRLQNIKWDRVEEKFIPIVLGVSGIALFLYVIWLGIVSIRHNLVPYNITLAAGKETGESYIISEALAKVVARKHSNIKIDVCETDGTGDNIKSLEDKALEGGAKCLSGRELTQEEKLKADLGTAQADIPPGMSTRIVANLHEDHFQLLVDPNKIQLPKNIEDFSFDAVKGKKIQTPSGGGQLISFENIAKYFLGDDYENPFFTENGKPDGQFFVRILGNEKVSKRIQEDGWKLVPIKQIEALKQTKYPAYLPSKIPQGIYQGSPAIPKVDLETIAVKRTLLARESVDDSVIEKITKVLIENRQEIKEEIIKIAKKREEMYEEAKEKGRKVEDNTFDPETIHTLLNLFGQPENSDVQIHKGALNYYESDQPSWVQEHVDILGLVLAFLVVVIPFILTQINQFQQRKLDEANEVVDGYIDKVVESMKSDTHNPGYNLTVNELIQRLEELFKQQEQLNQLFEEASDSLDRQEIFQSQFQSFTEAYKSAREVVKQAINDNQRKILASYANHLKELLNRLDAGESCDSLLIELDQLRIEATDKLLEERIFSRESFQTFVDTYNFVRDAMERCKKG